MNIIKGLDRIAIILAIIALIPGFVMGTYLFSDLGTKDVFLTPADEANGYIGFYGGKKVKSDIINNLDSFERNFIRNHIKVEPPTWQKNIAGIISSICIFFIVLYAFRGITRSTKILFLWIINGFKEDTTSNSRPLKTSIIKQVSENKPEQLKYDIQKNANKRHKSTTIICVLWIIIYLITLVGFTFSFINSTSKGNIISHIGLVILPVCIIISCFGVIFKKRWGWFSLIIFNIFGGISLMFSIYYKLSGIGISTMILVVITIVFLLKDTPKNWK